MVLSDDKGLVADPVDLINLQVTANIDGDGSKVAKNEASLEGDIAPAALIESPLYREGFALQPWQQGFVTECLKHLKEYGYVRILLADEVGLGKTLSMATAALAITLLQEQQGKCKPVVIFAPATLCEQWQTELMDKLGVPTARWHTQMKAWVDGLVRRCGQESPLQERGERQHRPGHAQPRQ